MPEDYCKSNKELICMILLCKSKSLVHNRFGTNNRSTVNLVELKRLMGVALGDVAPMGLFNRYGLALFLFICFTNSSSSCYVKVNLQSATSCVIVS